MDDHSTAQGTNRFRSAENLPELMDQLIAACTTGAPDEAEQISIEAKERLAELGLADWG